MLRKLIATTFVATLALGLGQVTPAEAATVPTVTVRYKDNVGALCAMYHSGYRGVSLSDLQVYASNTTRQRDRAYVSARSVVRVNGTWRYGAWQSGWAYDNTPLTLKGFGQKMRGDVYSDIGFQVYVHNPSTGRYGTPSWISTKYLWFDHNMEPSYPMNRYCY